MFGMSKTFWAAIAVIVIIFGGIVVFNKKDSSSTDTGTGQPSMHIFGEAKTGVALVEYGDFQCPYCAQFYPIIEQVKEKYKDQITFQFRNLPLGQHQNARAAARAAEAAGKQNKFWEMYGMIYQNQQAWAQSTSAGSQFEKYAAQLALNLTQYKKDFASPETNNTINADVAEFDKTKEEVSTPTFFLDGKKIKAASVDEFSKLIDTEIAAKAKAQS